MINVQINSRLKAAQASLKYAITALRHYAIQMEVVNAAIENALLKLSQVSVDVSDEDAFHLATMRSAQGIIAGKQGQIDDLSEQLKVEQLSRAAAEYQAEQLAADYSEVECANWRARNYAEVFKHERDTAIRHLNDSQAEVRYLKKQLANVEVKSLAADDWALKLSKENGALKAELAKQESLLKEQSGCVAVMRKQKDSEIERLKSERTFALECAIEAGKMETVYAKECMALRQQVAGDHRELRTQLKKLNDKHSVVVRENNKLKQNAISPEALQLYQVGMAMAQSLLLPKPEGTAEEPDLDYVGGFDAE